MKLKTMFPTQVFQDSIWSKSQAKSAFHRELLQQISLIQEDDRDGRKWCRDNYINGYTSYGTIADLHLRFPHFEELEKRIRRKVNSYAKGLNWDLQSGKLKMSTCWVNVMRKNTIHSLHLHPLSVISGTYYVQVPVGASHIKFEDPRLSKFMAAPPRPNLFVSLEPKEGDVILFESWLRHEVPLSRVAQPRISISFNYDWVE